jgi:ADP-ribose pyrophosphatase
MSPHVDLDNRFASHELVFDGKVAQAYAIEVRMDDGQVVKRDWFHYPGAAVIVPILDDGSIVMIRNRRFAVDETLLELPAGTLDAGEAPAICAPRELAEETGYVAGCIEPLGAFYSCPGTSDEKLYAFLATDLTGGEQSLEAHERIDVETYSPDEVRAMMRSGELHDGKSIAALGLYWLSKGEM